MDTNTYPLHTSSSERVSQFELRNLALARIVWWELQRFVLKGSQRRILEVVVNMTLGSGVEVFKVDGLFKELGLLVKMRHDHVGEHVERLVSPMGILEMARIGAEEVHLRLQPNSQLWRAEPVCVLEEWEARQRALARRNGIERMPLWGDWPELTSAMAVCWREDALRTLNKAYGTDGAYRTDDGQRGPVVSPGGVADGQLGSSGCYVGNGQLGPFLDGKFPDSGDSPVLGECSNSKGFSDESLPGALAAKFFPPHPPIQKSKPMIGIGTPRPKIGSGIADVNRLLELVRSELMELCSREVVDREMESMHKLWRGAARWCPDELSEALGELRYLRQTGYEFDNPPAWLQKKVRDFCGGKSWADIWRVKRGGNEKGRK